MRTIGFTDDADTGVVHCALIAIYLLKQSSCQFQDGPDHVINFPQVPPVSFSTIQNLSADNERFFLINLIYRAPKKPKRKQSKKMKKRK